MHFMDIFLMIGGSLIGGSITGIITVATLKNDMKWVIVLQDKLEQRIHDLERKILS